MNTNLRTFARTLTLTVATLLGTAGIASAAEPPAETDEVETSSSEETAKPSGLTGQVNLNTASSAEIELLPGIGPSIAGRIIDYRKDHPFTQRNHVMRIKGIGQKTFAKIKDFLAVEGETTLRLVK